MQVESGPQQADDRTAVDVVDDLADDAVGTETSGCVIGRQMENFRDDAAQQVVARAHDFFDDVAESRRWLRDFMGHDANVPGGTVFGIHAAQDARNEKPESFFRGLRVDNGLLDDFALRGANGFAENFGIETELVAKVIIDGGDVGSGAGSDFTHGGGVKTDVGENFTGCGDEFGPGGVRYGERRRRFS